MQLPTVYIAVLTGVIYQQKGWLYEDLLLTYPLLGLTGTHG